MFLSWTETWNLTLATTCKEDLFCTISLKLSWISLKLYWKELLNHLPAPDSKFATFFHLSVGWTFLVSEKGLEISWEMLENERLELSASVIKCIILWHGERASKIRKSYRPVFKLIVIINLSSTTSLETWETLRENRRLKLKYFIDFLCCHLKSDDIKNQ